MKKILMILTNTAQYPQTRRTTGLWLSEATEPYLLLSQAGYEIDFVSPKGGYVPIDPHSLRYASPMDLTFYNNEEF